MDNTELQLNNPDVESKGFGAILGLIYKNLILIICIMILSVLAGLGLAKLRDKTVYKATTSVMLRASLDKYQITSSSTDISLAKLILPDAKIALKSDRVINIANEYYNVYKDEYDIKNGGSISAGAISINNKSNSLILTISYSDYSGKIAEAKLKMFIKGASEGGILNDYIPVNIMELKSTQNDVTITSSNSFSKYMIFSVLVGLGICFIIVFMKSVLDTTVKGKKELENITGTTLLSYIDDIELYDKVHKNKY